MRLGILLLRKRSIPGNIYIGKNRVTPKVGPLAVEGARKRLAQEEENMFYLRQPYLTLEQSWGHAKELGKDKTWLYNVRQKQKKFQPDVTIEERFSVLKNNDRWD
ncbi:large ribosomal subunit protein mL63 [Oratosquilla oratoria]|uniref:large ribosomal subunit protein mL63 n=1 Tax=Oratosquilla oratoria TaxID=337810 RepID=UPI003F76B03F